MFEKLMPLVIIMICINVGFMSLGVLPIQHNIFFEGVSGTSEFTKYSDRDALWGTTDAIDVNNLQQSGEGVKSSIENGDITGKPQAGSEDQMNYLALVPITINVVFNLFFGFMVLLYAMQLPTGIVFIIGLPISIIMIFFTLEFLLQIINAIRGGRGTV